MALAPMQLLIEYAEHPERGITYWDWTLQPVKKATGEVEGLVLGLINVTRRIKAVEALRKSRKHFMTAQENEKNGLPRNSMTA